MLDKKVYNMKPRIEIQMTYDVITPESAEEGDVHDHGFAEPGGWRYSIRDDSFQERVEKVGRSQALRDMTPEPAVFSNVGEAIEYISKYRGGLAPSFSPGFHPGIWYTEYDPDLDYATGAETRLSFHVSGSTRIQYKIWDALKRGGVLV